MNKNTETKKSTEKNPKNDDLRVEELEERIAPATFVGPKPTKP